MRFTLALVVILLGILSGQSIAVPSGNPPQASRFQLVEEGDTTGSTRVYRVIFGDLQFRADVRLEMFETPNRVYISGINTPTPYSVASRSDLVPVIGEALRTTSGSKLGVVRALADLLLPHIDSPAATAAYISLSFAFPTPGWEVEYSRIPWKPADVSKPPAWYKHLGEDEVIDAIERRRAFEESDSTSVFLYSLYLLAMSDSPRSLLLIQQYFQDHPSDWIWGLNAMLRCRGNLPMASEPWKLLVTQIMPKLPSNLRTSYDIHTRLLAWWQICSCRAVEDIGGFSAEELASLGEAFVGALLQRPGFDRMFSEGIFPTGRNQEILSYDDLTEFLQICACFGTRNQLPGLRAILRSSEAKLFAADANVRWQSGIRGPSSGPTYEEAVKGFRESKANAIKSMDTRKSTLHK